MSPHKVDVTDRRGQKIPKGGARDQSPFGDIFGHDFWDVPSLYRPQTRAFFMTRNKINGIFGKSYQHVDNII